jgi:predicted metal-dependent hydrolase
MIRYTLIKSERKTISITVTPDGKIVVKAPVRAKKTDVDCFIREKQEWIKSHVSIQQETARKREEFLSSRLEKLTFLGREYPVVLKKPYGFDGECFTFPDLPFEQLRPSIIGFYRNTAKAYIAERVDFFARQMGVKPSAVKINSARTRWGSCSAKASLNFSWKLMLADKKIVDYVVVHELCHIKEMNHSPQFWSEVEKILPDYQERKAALKLVQLKITQECWE